MLKVAPTLIVDAVEPSLEFFTQRLGFTKVADVPGEDGTLVFAMLQAGAVEVHLQQRASLAKDMPYLAQSKAPPAAFLYIDVEDVQAVFATVMDCEILQRPEKKFYGATDFFLKEPGGHVIGFSQNG